jgi:hypothetical protein
MTNGSILVNGSDALLGGEVWGSGDVLLIGHASVEFGAAAASEIVLDEGATGLIQFDDSIDFSGTIAGFNGADRTALHHRVGRPGRHASDPRKLVLGCEVGSALPKGDVQLDLTGQSHASIFHQLMRTY